MTDKWLVIFCDPDPLTGVATRFDRFVYWLLIRFLKPGFRHCYAMRRANNFEGWLILNVTSDRAHVLEVADTQIIHMGGRTFDNYTDFVDWSERNGVATIVTLPEQPGGHCKVRSHFNCVTSVKHLLGIAAPSVLTPHGLFKHLGKEIANE